MSDQHREEVERGERFAFGRNWAQFLSTLDEEKIRLAEESLQRMLGLERLEGRTFLDAGSGSGLFSLAARRLGAKVRSFDFDPQSVACTTELRRRYFGSDPHWTVERGSVLDRSYLDSLGTYDVVYCWGVAHHTGRMWEALENLKPRVAMGGSLFIAIYNDLGAVTDRWRAIKRRYNRLPRPLQLPYVALIMGQEEIERTSSALRSSAKATWNSVLPRYAGLPRLSRPFVAAPALAAAGIKRGAQVIGERISAWRNYKYQSRGMSQWYDSIDWIGGYPYETASLEAIVDFFDRDGFMLTNVVDRSNGYGCNEFVFRRAGDPGTAMGARIPTSRFVTRQRGYRVDTEPTANGSEVRATLPAAMAVHSAEDVVVFAGDRLVGNPRALTPDGREALLPAGLAGRTDLQIVRGKLRTLAPPFRHADRHRFAAYVPDLKHLAENAAGRSGRSPVFMFEGEVPLPYPGSLHRDLVMFGEGRYSHWGEVIFFSALDNSDPNTNRRTYSLIVAEP